MPRTMDEVGRTLDESGFDQWERVMGYCERAKRPNKHGSDLPFLVILIEARNGRSKFDPCLYSRSEFRANAVS